MRSSPKQQQQQQQQQQQSNSNNYESEGYFDLSDSFSGEGTGDSATKRSLPDNNNERDSGVADEQLHRRSYESSDSSGPGDSLVPAAPPKTPLSKTEESIEDCDIYDIPPAYPRHSFSSDSGAIYDCPPARRGSQPIDTFNDMDIYKTVPPPRPTKTSISSLDFPVAPLKNGALSFDTQEATDSDIYDVPPVLREPPASQQVYDTPPVNFHKGEVLSQSTDNLAKTFQNISFRNSIGAHSITSESGDLYDIPGSPVNVNDTGNFIMPSTQDFGPTSPPLDMAPPRPPKPAHMQGPVTPPPSFDDTYDIPPNLQSASMNAVDLTNRLSQEIQGQKCEDSPPTWSNTHSWQDNKKPSSIRYINTKRDPNPSSGNNGMPANPHLPPRTNSLDGPIPAPDPDSYINVRNERYVFAPNNLPPPSQSCYTPMQGSSANSTNFEFSEETYMAMEGSVDGGGGMVDSYTFMSSPSAGSTSPMIRSQSVSSRNSQGELPPPAPMRRTMSTSSRNSQGEAPPPVNRNSKPDRRQGE